MQELVAEAQAHNWKYLFTNPKTDSSYKAIKRGWKITLQIKEVGSGAKTRTQREELLKAARRREVDVIIV